VYDPKGFIWLKNNSGIYRMNVESGKYEFLGKPESFSSSSNSLVYFEDTIWLSPSAGHVSHFENGVWETEEIEAGYAYGLYVFGDELWFLGNEGIRFRKGGEWRSFIFPEEYTRGYGGMARSGDGSLWFSSYEAVLEYDGTNWIEHKNLNGLNRMVSLDNGEVLFIYEGLILEYKNGKFSPLVLPEDTYRYSLRNSFVDPNGDFWFVNGCNGACRYNGTEWVQFDAEKLGGFVPSQIMFAPDGATWFFSYDSWARYQPEE